MLEALRRCYGLFNHTIAPEPDGTWLGSSGYCHRTPGDWTSAAVRRGPGADGRGPAGSRARYPDHARLGPPGPDHGRGLAAAGRDANLDKDDALLWEDFFSRGAGQPRPRPAGPSTSTSPTGRSLSTR